MSNKDILGLAVTGQAIALAKDNLKNATKKKPSILKQGVKNIVGTTLIGETANAVAKL